MYDDNKNKLRLLPDKIVVGYLKKHFKICQKPHKP